MTSTQDKNQQPARNATALQFARSICHLVAVAAVTAWGFMSWPLPFPGILTGIGFFAAVTVIWALFLSPRPVLRTDRFGQALVELLVLAAAIAAMLDFGWFWVWPALFGAVAAIIGYLASTRR